MMDPTSRSSRSPIVNPGATTSTLNVHGNNEATDQRDETWACAKWVSGVGFVSSMLSLHQKFGEVDFFDRNCWNLLMQSVQNLFFQFRFAVRGQQPSGLPRR